MDMSDESEAVLDQLVLASLRELQEDGEPDILEEVGSLFLNHAPDKMSAIEKAVEQKDANSLKIAAHSLKSSSAYVGAMRLSALCKDLEMMGRSGSMRGSEEKAEMLKTEFLRVKIALEMEIKK
jgi:HPt (histidine-containing phosphotransfer) domain-containing protein